MISTNRLQHGEGRVTVDSTLNRIAREQAAAMASRDVLDHGVLGPFSSRVASSKSERAAENIAFGYDDFSKTLDQWIDSPEHRKNLLMHGASKVGVASAKPPDVPPRRTDLSNKNSRSVPVNRYRLSAIEYLLCQDWPISPPKGK